MSLCSWLNIKEEKGSQITPMMTKPQVGLRKRRYGTLLSGFNTLGGIVFKSTASLSCSLSVPQWLQKYQCINQSSPTWLFGRKSFTEQGLTINISWLLVSQGCSLSPLPQCWEYKNVPPQPAFHAGSRTSNPDTHACVASTWLTEFSH